MSSSDEIEGCIFCAALEEDDDRVHIVHRAESTFVILNAFPYNTGHVMVAPKRHVGELDELTSEERAELMETTIRSTAAIRSAMSPEGFNVGINLGRVAGAGIPGHVHVHVVPRWAGDTNFMPIVGETKILPEMLAETYAKLRPAFTESS